MRAHWMQDLVREPIVEGLFYPDDPGALNQAVKTYLINARSVISNPRAVIVPNASLEFIGTLAAEAYKRVQGNSYDRVVVIGPLRDHPGEAFLLPESTSYRTPLDISRVDLDALELLLSSSTAAEVSEITHLQEHSIEVQLPWLQHILPEVPIVPLLISSTNGVGVRALASALQILEQESAVRTLYVASLNLTPSLPLDIAASQAGQFISLLLEGRQDELIAARRRGELRSDGCAAAAVLSLLHHRSCRVEALCRGNSFGYDKSDSSVVEYASIIYEYPVESGGSADNATH